MSPKPILNLEQLKYLQVIYKNKVEKNFLSKDIIPKQKFQGQTPSASHGTFSSRGVREGLGTTGVSIFKIMTTGFAPTPLIVLDVPSLVGMCKTRNSSTVALTSTIMLGSTDSVF